MNVLTYITDGALFIFCSTSLVILLW